MYRELSAKGVRVPNGFAVTADASWAMLGASGAAALHEALDGLDPSDVDDLARRSRKAQEVVYGVGVPAEVEAEILAAYRRLQGQYGEDVRLAVRSFATAEDFPSASFAGQQDTFLNIRGDQASSGVMLSLDTESGFSDVVFVTGSWGLCSQRAARWERRSPLARRA